MARARTADLSSVNVKNLKKDLQSLRDDLSDLAKQVEGVANGAGAEVIDDVKARLANFGSSVDELIGSAGARGREAVDAVSDMGGNIVDNVEDAIRDRLLTAVAVAVGLGFILSSTLRR
jgi:ElaB/YqjD/DUF883 family membrane-anchored ribosome-binding protein